MASSFLSIINLTIICGISLMIQLVFWYGVFNRLNLKNQTGSRSELCPRVCVLICAKNAEAELAKLIPQLLKQNYPDFYILVANDFSSDNTESILKSFKSDKVQYFNVQTDHPGKKQAIIEALEVMDADWIMFTDADCQPEGASWISEMMSSSSAENKSIVLGYSPYLAGDSILSKWIAFENWLTGVMYLSFAIIGRPYMGVGRNMAIKASIYKKDHLKSHTHISSGDDDLTLQKLFTEHNYTINLSRESFVWTQPASTVRDYIQQKLRHFTTASSYPPEIKFVLIIYPLSQVLFLVSALILLWKFLLVGLYFILIRWLVLFPVYRRLRRIMELDLNFLLFICFDVLLAVYYSIFSLSFILPKTRKW